VDSCVSAARALDFVDVPAWGSSRRFDRLIYRADSPLRMSGPRADVDGVSTIHTPLEQVSQ
jgi:hypothetical protein